MFARVCKNVCQTLAGQNVQHSFGFMRSKMFLNFKHSFCFRLFLLTKINFRYQNVSHFYLRSLGLFKCFQFTCIGNAQCSNKDDSACLRSLKNVSQFYNTFFTWKFFFVTDDTQLGAKNRILWVTFDLSDNVQCSQYNVRMVRAPKINYLGNESALLAGKTSLKILIISEF